MKKLVKSDDRMVCGVCGGVAEYLGIDPTVVRVAWVIVTMISGGIGLVGYIAGAALIPESTDIY